MSHCILPKYGVARREGVRAVRLDGPPSQSVSYVCLGGFIRAMARTAPMAARMPVTMNAVS